MKKALLIIFCLIAIRSAAQEAFSIATDLSVLRQLSVHQKFWSVGQTVQANFHFTKKESAYALVSYYTNGKFKNSTTAFAKDATVTPAEIKYSSNTILRYRQISLGWKHFFAGNYLEENSLNIYGTAGFGLLFGRVETSTSLFIDTLKYNAKPISGASGFKRLTFDIAIGGERHIGGGVYFYSEVRSWLQASENPSPFLYRDKIPFVVSVNGGIRILIL